MHRITSYGPLLSPTQPETTTPTPRQDSELMTTQEAAKYLRISARSMERYRVTGQGPNYTKVGPGLRSRVLYRKTDLDVWLAGFQYSSTSEYSDRD